MSKSIMQFAVLWCLIAGLAGCPKHMTQIEELRLRLRRHYQNDKIDVSFHNSVGDLQIEFFDPSVSGLSEPEAVEKAREIGRFALKHYDRREEIERLTIAFVVRRNGKLLPVTRHIKFVFANEELAALLGEESEPPSDSQVDTRREGRPMPAE